jgi:hypothetical protein
MHAVIAMFEMPPEVAETTRAQLDDIVTRIRAEPGFVAGYWTHGGARPVNMLVFDTASAAEARAADIRGNVDQQRSYGIVPIDITVAEIVAAAVP